MLMCVCVCVCVCARMWVCVFAIEIKTIGPYVHIFKKKSAFGLASWGQKTSHGQTMLLKDNYINEQLWGTHNNEGVC